MPSLITFTHPDFPVFKIDINSQFLPWTTPAQVLSHLISFARSYCVWPSHHTLRSYSSSSPPPPPFLFKNSINYLVLNFPFCIFISVLLSLLWVAWGGGFAKMRNSQWRICEEVYEKELGASEAFKGIYQIKICMNQWPLLIKC